jgi:Tol biopolymer transport system component
LHLKAQVAAEQQNGGAMKLQKFALVVVVLFVFVFSFSSFSTTASSEELPVRDIELFLEMGEGEIETYYLEGETAVFPETNNSPEINSMPPFSSHIAYQALNNNNWDIYMFRLYSGGNPTRLTNSPAADTIPALRNGANRLAFVSNRDGDDDVYRLDISNNNLLNVSRSGSDDLNPDWTIDGAKIAFNSYRTGNSEVFVSNNDGSGLRQLTNHPAYDGQPSWSPDGSQIVFSSSRTGRYQLWVMNADGSNQRQLTFGAHALYPAWSPAGNTIAYASDGNNDGWFELWLVNADGTNPRRHLIGVALVDYWLPDWSPDGRAIAFTGTTWVYYNGQFYWTASEILLADPLVPNQFSTTFHAPNSFYPSWAAADGSPPSACVIQSNALQHDRAFVLAWAASDVGDAGIGSYDVEMRLNATSPWQRIANATPRMSMRYEYAQDSSRQFRCRARDRAFNLGGWGAAKTIAVDTVWPDSAVKPLQETTRGPVLVQWSGNSANLTYDVYVREGTGGNWQLWQNGVSATSAMFNSLDGQTYYFRSQARDGRQLERWQAEPDTAVTLYAYEVSGFVSDNRGYPVGDAVVETTPAPARVWQNALNGAYELWLGQASSHTFNFAAPGYKPLPPTAVSLSQDLTLNAILPPADDAIVNGSFEVNTLAGWTVTGPNVAAAANARHSGAYGLAISHATAAETAITQTVVVGQDWANPTLSFLYQIPAALDGGAFRVEIAQGDTVTTALHTAQATAGWQHVWTELAVESGQTITITLAADHAIGTIWVDEVSLGSWTTPGITAVSPTQWQPQQPATLIVTGTNFLETPAVFLNQLALNQVTWISDTRLEIAVPATIPEGGYTLSVVNPGGAKAVAPRPIIIGQERLLLPLIVKSSPVANAAPTADWLTLGHDAAHTGYNPTDPGASRYHLRWSQSLPYPGGSPLHNIAISHNVVVATSEVPHQMSALVAYDAQTGAEKWRQPLDGTSVSPPTIANGVVYITQNTTVTHVYNYASFLHAFDLFTGTKLWSTSLYICCGQSEKYFQPTVAEGRVFLGSGSTFAYNAFTGVFQWRGPGGDPPWTPAYHNGSVYVANLYFFYRFPANSQNYTWVIEISEDPLTTLIAGDRAIISGQTKLTGVNLNSRAIAWSHEGDYARNPVAAADGVLYSLNGSLLEARDLATGALIWNYEAGVTLINAPVVAGDYVYVASEGQTFVINRHSRQLVWSTDKGGWLAVANGYLFVAARDKIIYAYRAEEP